ncbi:hypothetical protein GCM10009759_30750 [Kitasatospora saccharophila]|uniref:Uncharacterized protein n=1 Tax=Kitasatospora saccharophila TaxID=407973 RepID=A0ABN2WU10_9ACTN
MFTKTGVGNRAEPCTETFTRHRLPVVADPPLSTDGRLIGSAGGAVGA